MGSVADMKTISADVVESPEEACVAAVPVEGKPEKIVPKIVGPSELPSTRRRRYATGLEIVKMSATCSSRCSLTAFARVEVGKGEASE